MHFSRSGFSKLLLSYLMLPFSILVSATSAFSADEGVEALKKALVKHVPAATEITQVSETPIPGLYQVIVDGQVLYMDQTARYMLDGDLVDLATRKNHTESAKSGIRLAVMDKLGEDKMVVYTPKKVDQTITVVTDIDCPYCRRLHSEIDQYMAANVKVRYIFMPLKGKSDFDTTVSVWCAKDQNKALDLAKAGADIESLSCDNPIQQHLTLSREMGIRGTPAIILESGMMLGGYVPAEKLLPELSKLQAAMVAK
jgi:thiol:disulfide interchange protein DsbC